MLEREKKITWGEYTIFPKGEVWAESQERVAVGTVRMIGDVMMQATLSFRFLYNYETWWAPVAKNIQNDKQRQRQWAIDL